ncbi:P-type conjugative transfer protein VirB9 [Anaplasma capra]|uniref:P-type conjugative transfer protein VirB9 n=1 Tax=Anaplasma capra TaxID=1562740 RepID=UPI00294FFBB4|nr:P-type conjugative transfer protein VirB9 [Anaplasma capra]
MNFYKNLLAFSAMLAVVFAGGTAQSAADGGVPISADRPISVDSRIKTFVYSPNEIFTVVFNYGYHSFIEFSRGETIKVMAMGDSAHWKVKPVDNKLFIMPLEREGKTNMLVETNKGRSYAFDLVSKSGPDAGESRTVADELGKVSSPLIDLAYVVRFYYPETNREFDLKGSELVDLSIPSLAKSPDSAEVTIRPNATGKNYVYSASSSDATVIPVQTFDDGSLTYFQFYNNNKVIPRVFQVGKHGKKVPCKMLLLKGYVIIKGVHKQLYLDYGNSGVEVVNTAFN